MVLCMYCVHLLLKATVIFGDDVFFFFFNPLVKASVKLKSPLVRGVFSHFGFKGRLEFDS